MSGRPSASRSATVRSSARHAAGVDHDARRPLGRARDAIERHADVLLAPAGDELVAAVPVDVEPADRVAAGERLVDHLPGPRPARRLRRLAVDRHRRAVPRLDHGEHAGAADASDLHLAGVDVAEARLRPAPVGAALEQVQALAARGDQLVVAVAVEVEHGEVVDDVQRVVDQLGRPRILGGILGHAQREQPRTDAVPLGRRRAAAVQRRDDQLGIARAVDVRPADAMQRRLGGDVAQRPARARRARRGPVERAAAVRVARLPGGAEGDVEAAVAIDVVRRQRDVVLRRLPVEHDVRLPRRVLEPDQLRAADREDVRLPVAVDVRDGHRVADAEVVSNLLGFEANLALRRWRERQRERGEEQQDSHGSSYRAAARGCAAVRAAAARVAVTKRRLWPIPSCGLSSPRARGPAATHDDRRSLDHSQSPVRTLASRAAALQHARRDRGDARLGQRHQRPDFLARAAAAGGEARRAVARGHQGAAGAARARHRAPCPRHHRRQPDRAARAPGTGRQRPLLLACRAGALSRQHLSPARQLRDRHARHRAEDTDARRARACRRRWPTSRR